MNGSSERLTGAGRGRTRMAAWASSRGLSLRSGRGGSRAGEPLAVGTLGMDGLVDNAAVCLSKWGGERETEGGSELALGRVGGLGFLC